MSLEDEFRTGRSNVSTGGSAVAATSTAQPPMLPSPRARSPRSPRQKSPRSPRSPRFGATLGVPADSGTRTRISPRKSHSGQRRARSIGPSSRSKAVLFTGVFNSSNPKDSASVTFAGRERGDEFMARLSSGDKDRAQTSSTSASRQAALMRLKHPDRSTLLTAHDMKPTKEQAASLALSPTVPRLKLPSKGRSHMRSMRIDRPMLAPNNKGGSPSGVRDLQRLSVPLTPTAARLVDAEQAIATFDFDDDDPEKLSFVKGDIIQLLDESEVQFGWLQGQLGSRRGWFPANRIERIKRKQLLVALYPLQSKEIGYLSFNVGDVISVINAPAANSAWYDGELNGVIGKVPANYVKLVAQSFDDPARRHTLQKVIRYAGVDAPVLPEGKTVPNLPTQLSTRKGVLSPRSGREYSAAYLPPIPFLRVGVVRARRLPRVVLPSDRLGSASLSAAGGVGVVPSAYADIVLGAQHGATHAVHRTGAPEWNIEFPVPLVGASLLSGALKISLWHNDAAAAAAVSTLSSTSSTTTTTTLSTMHTVAHVDNATGVNDDQHSSSFRRALSRRHDNAANDDPDNVNDVNNNNNNNSANNEQHAMRAGSGGGGDARPLHNVFIGEVLLPVTYIREQRHRKGWYPLQTNANRGDLRLRLQYNSDERVLQIEVVSGRGLSHASPFEIKASVRSSVVVQCGDFYATTPARIGAAPMFNIVMRASALSHSDDLIVTVYDDTNNISFQGAGGDNIDDLSGSIRRGSAVATAPNVSSSSSNAAATIASGRLTIGDIVIPLAYFKNNLHYDDWFPLTTRILNTNAGDIYLDLEFVDK